MRDARESRRSRTRAAVYGLSLLLLSPTVPSAAQSLEEARILLNSHSPEEVATGIQTLGLVGTAAALPPLEQRIRRGLPPRLLALAVATMAAIGLPAASSTLISLASHRRPAIRARSCEALGALKAADGYHVLIRRLADEDPEVRAAAAGALGELSDPKALPPLFQALGRGNLAAATAIGRLTPGKDAPRLLSYLSDMPFRSLSPALAEVLRRADIHAAIKVDLIHQMTEVGTGEVAEFLKDVLTGSQPPPDRQLSDALGRAILEIEK